MPRKPKTTPDGGPRTLPTMGFVDQLDPVEGDPEPHVRPQGMDQVVLCIDKAARSLPNPTYREVYRAIANYADETGTAQPTMEQVALEPASRPGPPRGVVPNLARLGCMAIRQEVVTEGPNKGCYHNLYQLPQVAAGWQAPALLPVEEANKPITDRLLEQQDRIIEAKDRRIAELERMLGIEPSADADFAPKGSRSSSNNDYDDGGTVQNLHPSTSSPRETVEGRPGASTCSGDRLTCSAGAASHQGYDEVKAWVDSEWRGHLSNSWNGTRDQAIWWYLHDLDAYQRQREDREGRRQPSYDPGIEVEPGVFMRGDYLPYTDPASPYHHLYAADADEGEVR